MGWLDNLWRRRQGRTTETPADRAETRAAEREAERADEDTADVLEERAEDERTEQVLREPRKPPGTG